jgi:DNA-binding transcriptional MerR regulator
MPHDNTSSHASSAPKANGAYKTISEVSEEIDVPQHVLRFWESHFPQVKPSRMRGSRRYYRPEDVDVLKTIKTLLYNKGYTIKGAKQVVRDGNVIANEVPIAAKPAPVVAAPVATPKAATTAAEKKNIDTKALVNELRVLKSMLTSLL